MSGLDSDTSEKMVLGVSKIRPLRPSIPEEYRQENSIYRIRDTVPRLLLRPIYEQKENWNKKYAFVLCDLETTQHAISSNCVDFIIDTEVMTIQGGFIYGFPRNVVMEILSSPVNMFTVTKSFIFRIDVAHSSMAECKKLNDKKNEFRWQLFIDTHLDLVRYMLEFDTYDDASLLDPQVNKTSPLRSAVEQYYPHDTRFSYCGELPDLTGCIDMGNLWYNIRPKDDNIFAALVHICICKPQHQKCQFRNFMRILLRYFEDFPVMIDLFRLLLEMSLLGNYDHSSYRPKFHKRLEIKSSFSSGRISDFHLCLWMAENEHLVYYITKEFYAYTVTQSYIMDITLKKTSHWETVKSIIYDAMDIVRSTFCRSFNEEDRFKDIEVELKRIHDESLIYLTKLRKSVFLVMILAEFNKYREKHFVSQEQFEFGEKLEELIPDINVRNAIHYCARYVSRRMDNMIETKWLKCFGISEIGYELFRDLYFDYEKQDIADNAISRRLGLIYEKNRMDFEIIRNFLRLVNDYRSTREYSLTADYYRNCVVALRTKLQLLPWEVLPDNADTFHYCRTCNKWANPVVDDGGIKGGLNIYATGFEKALWDHTDDMLYCGKPPSSNNNRKPIIEKSNSKNSSRNKAKKEAHRSKEVKLCKDTQLIPVHMLGKQKRLGNKLWVLCETCASLIEVEPEKFNMQGHTCSFHRRDYVKPQTKEVGTYSNSSDELDNLRHSMAVDDIKLAERCWYCLSDRSSITKAQNGQQPITIRLINDDNNGLKVETCLMCFEDYTIATDLFLNNELVKKSFAIKTIASRRLKRAININFRGHHT